MGSRVIDIYFSYGRAKPESEVRDSTVRRSRRCLLFTTNRSSFEPLAQVYGAGKRNGTPTVTPAPGVLPTHGPRADDVADTYNRPMRPVVVFDVNETLLDLAPINEWFAVRYDGAISASQWFSELLRLSFVSAATDRYLPFTSLAADALTSTAVASGFDASHGDADTLGRLMLSLEPHADVREGIRKLANAGFTVAALTNSPQVAAVAQIHHAGLDDLLDPILSVEMVRRFKPHASVYLAAAEQLGVSTSDMAMVAAHDWDIAGAMAAGCRGVFIERGGRPYSPAFAAPSMVARDVSHAADQLIAMAR